MFDFGSLSFPYKILKDLLGILRRNKRVLSPAEKVKLRQKWQKEFEEKIYERRKKKLRTDVIIRDMKRIDDYPDAKEERKGISAWFKVGLMGTYHRGILVGLRWDQLAFDEKHQRWRHVDYGAGEEGVKKVILIGYIPFENIESVNWDGDNIYGFPHIYCYFDAKGKQPYEKLAFCEQNFLDEYPFYTEVEEYREVRKFSKKCKIKGIA